MKTRLNLRTIKLLTLIISLFIFISCGDDEVPPTEQCFEHFNYDAASEEGPAHWDNYCVAEGVVNECGSTVRQSPIDIVGAVEDNNLSALKTVYATSTTDILNNGHTIQFNYNGDAVLTFGGTDYSLLQFHFHAASEHTVGGKQHPLEAHFVHKSGTGALAVIGVFFEVGVAAENTFLNQFIADLPALENETHVDAALSYNASDLFPENKSYFNYGGSLTTPPCSEIVEWIVMENPVKASQTQLDAFASILHDNFRPVQPLSGRTIKAYIAP